MRFFIIYAVLFFILCSSYVKAQSNFIGRIKPTVGLKVPLDNAWSLDFETANRDNFYHNEAFDFEFDYWQFDGFVNYKLNKVHTVSLGLRYRIRNLIDHDAVNEKRLIQEYNHSKKVNSIGYKGRFLLEERFRSENNLRVRYRFRISIPLTKNPQAKRPFSMDIQTEALVSLWVDEKASLDQRTSLGLSKALSQSTSLSALLEHRYLDYLNKPKILWILELKAKLAL